MNENISRKTIVRYAVPLFSLNYNEREERAVLHVLRSKWISSGPKCLEFEKKITQMLDVRYAVSLSSCTAALHLALRLLNIQAGDEVLVPSLTFVATVSAVKYVGATPVFCDVTNYDNLNIDPRMIAANITRRTKAIIVMHYAGFPANMRAILKLSQKHNVKVVEDACHGPLSEYEGHKLGTLGDLGCFSFFANKNICTGEGGMLVTNNSRFYDKAKILRSHGMTSSSYERSIGKRTSYEVMDLGYNYRFDDIRASIGLVQLAKLRRDMTKRAAVRRYYLTQLAGMEDIVIPFKDYTGLVSNYIFPVILKNAGAGKRDLVRQLLAKKGIETSMHYPAVHKFSLYRSDTVCLPITEYIAANLITLPMFGMLSLRQIDYVCLNLKNALRKVCKHDM